MFVSMPLIRNTGAIYYYLWMFISLFLAIQFSKLVRSTKQTTFAGLVANDLGYKDELSILSDFDRSMLLSIANLNKVSITPYTGEYLKFIDLYDLLTRTKIPVYSGKPNLKRVK